MIIKSAWLQKSAGILGCTILLFGASACTEGVKDGPGMENPNPPATQQEQASPGDTNAAPPQDNQHRPEANQQSGNKASEDNPGQPAQPSRDVSHNNSANPQEKPNIEALSQNKVLIVDVRDGFYGMTRNEIAKIDSNHYLVTMSDDDFIKWATRPNGTNEEIRDSVKEIAKFSKSRLSFDKDDMEKLIHKHSQKDINILAKKAAEERESITEVLEEYSKLSVPFEVNVYYEKVKKGLLGLDRAAENAAKLSSAQSEQEINNTLADIRSELDCANDNLLSSQGIAAGILEDHSK